MCNGAPTAYRDAALFFDEQHEPAASASNAVLTGLFAEIRIPQGPKRLAWFLTSKPELLSTAQVSVPGINIHPLGL